MKIVLDSYAFMAYVQKEPGSSQVIKIFAEGVERQGVIFLSLVNWGEIYCCISRSDGQKIAEEILQLIDQLPITLVPIDRDLTYSAASFKSRYALSYADCFAAALAQRENCPVLTGDKEFQKLHKEIQIKWL